ncbi:hypothetical protein KO498_12250 [Lentibacter algarum]|uniref:hypothetical protein n=1 Tax=Lentibacter algarum TaxID=576131 RepID=UPI001C094AE9|nr:hypothetical protein [Lentibacter algarum]MBU2982581.1 hypothetical protein [Lentibacter algarum]
MLKLIRFAGCLGLAMMTASASNAGPDRFSVLLGSKHIGATGFNELNPGLFATWERETWAYSFGAYVNSYERGSLAATAHYPLTRWKSGDLSLFGGLAWYPKDGRRFNTHIAGDVVAIGGLHLRQGHVFVQLVPMTAGGADGLLSFGLTWETGSFNR